MKIKKQYIGIVIIFAILSNLFYVLAPYYIGIIIDNFDNINILKNKIFILCFIYFFTFFFNIIYSAFINKMIIDSTYELIRKFVQLILQMDYLKLEEMVKSNKIVDIFFNIKIVEKDYFESFSKIVICIVSAILAFFMMFFINYFLAIVCLLLLIVIYFINKYSTKISIEKENVNLSSDIIKYIHLLKNAGYKDKILKEYNKMNSDYNKIVNIEIFKIVIIPMIKFLKSIIAIVVVYFIARMIINKEISLGVGVAYYGYMIMFIYPVTNMMYTFSKLRNSEKLVNEIDGLYNDLDKYCEQDTQVEHSNVLGNIEFKDVTCIFKNNIIMKNINFTIKNGERVGIFTENKQEIIDLLLRFYEDYDGKILLDGKDIKEYDKYDYRRQFVPILKTIYFLEETIKNNLLFINSDENLIYEYSKKLDLHYMIEVLKDGYDTKISKELITAQHKRLLSILRSSLIKSNVVVFDTYMMELDKRSISNVKKFIDEEYSDKTRIVIANKMSYLEGFDKILNVKTGEVDSYENFMRKGEKYV